MSSDFGIAIMKYPNVPLIPGETKAAHGVVSGFTVNKAFLIKVVRGFPRVVIFLVEHMGRGR